MRFSSRRQRILGALAVLCGLLLEGKPVACAAADTPRLPNLVMVYADDLGWGDLGCYGSTTNRTPHLDGLAKQGLRCTSFYSAQPVCSASRMALLTGCYANRVGIHGALGPQARQGIHADEMTLAEVSRQKGYATAAIGKWHLGHHREFLPLQHGFDSYFGLPYSNDMWPYHPEAKPGSYPKLPLFRNNEIVDDDVTADDQRQLTRRYTEEAVTFIQSHHERPFCLYLAHSMPHVPLFAGEKFQGTQAGTYADVLSEIDWSVGEILRTLDELKLEQNTLVIFASDNGPWLSYGNHGGSSGPWREGKGTVFEGGVRVPFLARWPGKIPAGAVQNEMAMTLDLLPTWAGVIGAELPAQRIDGRDILPLLLGTPGAKTPHEAYYFYYHVNELQALRSGPWKLHFPHTARSMQGQDPGVDGVPGKYKPLPVPLSLYNLETDPGETQSVVESQPEVLAKLLQLAESAREDLGDSLTQRAGTGRREPGRLPPLPPR